MPETLHAERFAAIDVGSNAMRCLIVEIDEEARPRILESVRAPVRLGTHVFLTGRIGAVAGAQTLEAFAAFRRLLDVHGVTNVRAIATSAAREAMDADDVFDRVREETGIEVRVIGGAEEAHLVRRAVASRLDLHRGRSAAVDVGGGSVEVMVIRKGDVVRTESFDIGAVRLLEALPGDGEQDFFALLEHHVDAIRSRVFTALGKEPVEFLSATGGSIETLADLVGEKAKGHPALSDDVRVIPLDRLRAKSLELAGHSHRERMEKFGLRPDRADVILPASVVYMKIAEIFGVDRVYVPDVGLKDGLILDMVEDLLRQGAVTERRREVRAAALGLGRRYSLDEPHAEKVTEIALSLFDQLTEVHHLGDEARTLLEAAGILHDVGLYISASRHHKHSYYLISASDLVGLDSRQREIVANVARYHRKRHPTKKHEHYLRLAPADQGVVRKLSAILRVADVLDREHRQQVHVVEASRKKGKLRLSVRSDGDLLLERWAAARKFELFEEVFGLKPEIVSSGESTGGQAGGGLRDE